MQVSERDVGGRGGRGGSGCRRVAGVLEGNERRIRIQLTNRDVGGWGEEDQDAGEWQGCWTWRVETEGSECRWVSVMLDGGERRIRMQVSGRDVGSFGEEDQDAGEWQGWWRVEIFCIFISGSTSWHKCS